MEGDGRACLNRSNTHRAALTRFTDIAASKRLYATDASVPPSSVIPPALVLLIAVVPVSVQAHPHAPLPDRLCLHRRCDASLPSSQPLPLPPPHPLQHSMSNILLSHLLPTSSPPVLSHRPMLALPPHVVQPRRCRHLPRPPLLSRPPLLQPPHIRIHRLERAGRLTWAATVRATVSMAVALIIVVGPAKGRVVSPAGAGR